MSKIITLKVQQLGEQLAVCIPDEMAKAARLVVGQSVTVEIPTTPEELRDAQQLVPTLEQMLSQYDPEKFGGEVMGAPLLGKEIIK
jgi:antitoxin MazE